MNGLHMSPTQLLITVVFLLITLAVTFFLIYRGSKAPNKKWYIPPVAELHIYCDTRCYGMCSKIVFKQEVYIVVIEEGTQPGDSPETAPNKFNKCKI